MREEVSAAEAVSPGITLGPWKVLQRLDSGSYGVVFLVERAGHPEAGLFALKLAKQSWDERFEREARLLQRCVHPGVARFEDMGVWTGPDDCRYPYIVMECVAGLTLYDWFRAEPRTHVEVLEVLRQVARGLEAVHAAGALHRDVKGDNIRVTPEGRAVLVDFGSGWMPGARPLTDTAAPPGTAPYRAPELLRFIWKFRRDDEARWHARPTDDLYALGVTAYRLVTGTYPPPVTETESQGPRKVMRPRELVTVMPELDDLIMRLLSEDRDARGTARKAAEDLERAKRAAAQVNGHIVPKSPAGAADTEAPSSSFRASEPSRSHGSSRSTSPERRRSRAVSAWLSWASAAAVGGLIMAFVEHLRRPGPVEPAGQEPARATQDWHAPAVDTPDAGVSEEALASAQGIPRTGVPAYAIGLPMPKSPFPGQRKPPCDPRTQRAINGGCWTGPIGTERPPCGSSAFDHDDGCYVPFFDAPRAPTSDPP
jgi:serine/threonine protein kinase